MQITLLSWSPSASLQIKGLATKHTTVKWPIVKYTVGLSYKPSYNYNNNNNNNLT